MRPDAFLNRGICGVKIFRFLSTPTLFLAILLAVFLQGSAYAKIYCDPQIKANAATARIAAITKDINRFQQSYKKPDSFDDMFCGTELDKAFDKNGEDTSGAYDSFDQTAKSQYQDICKKDIKAYGDTQNTSTQQSQCAATQYINLFGAGTFAQTVFNMLSGNGARCPSMDQLSNVLQNCSSGSNLQAKGMNLATCITQVLQNPPANTNGGLTNTITSPTLNPTTTPSTPTKDCPYDVCTGDRI